MDHGIVTDIAWCIIAAWVVGVVCQVARQPLLIAYLVAGFAIGPQGFEVVTNADSIRTMSEIGLALLLFMIGLEMDLKKMLGSGGAITVTALVQISGGIALGWLIFRSVGPAGGSLEALYLAVAAAMSSTVIIVKLLHEKRELETLAGRVTMGILVIQDVAAILFLAIQPTLKEPALGPLVEALGRVLQLVGAAYFAGRFILPPVFKLVARRPELVLVGALAWCFAMAGFASYLGLSREMGALLAGVMVSTFPYTLDVVARVTSIRDFFVTLFFVSLGMIIPMPTWDYLFWMLVVSAVLLLTRFITVFPTLFRMGLGQRMSLLPAVNLGQLSELSLVLLAIGKTAGDVSDKTISITAFAFAFLAVLSTYGILRSDSVVRRAGPILDKLGFPDLPAGTHDAGHGEEAPDVFILGFCWTASSLLEEITREKPTLLPRLMVVDFNPETANKLRDRDIQVMYGDISRPDVLEHAGISHAKVIICSLGDGVLRGSTNRKMLLQLRALNPDAEVVVHADKISDVHALYADGASYVITPRLLEAGDLLGLLDAIDKDLTGQKRGEQLARLEERREVIP
ncbi:cation:proton antiporter [Haloferula sp. BvORR071]|uniref:cation:proton antiporter n=1 Tax=Haloferula sp. BvORR071 TaxID=1396141 RepID=UPI00054D81F3|nr:cation:proton antiporter [Haloferula sp. BvORR071]